MIDQDFVNIVKSVDNSIKYKKGIRKFGSFAIDMSKLSAMQEPIITKHIDHELKNFEYFISSEIICDSIKLQLREVTRDREKAIKLTIQIMQIWEQFTLQYQNQDYIQTTEVEASKILDSEML